MPLVRVETVALDDAQVGHCRFDPGWRWSESMGPMLGVASCPMRHLGYTVSGSHPRRHGRRPGARHRARRPCSRSRPATTSGSSATSRGSRSSGAAAGARCGRPSRSAPGRMLATVAVHRHRRLDGAPARARRRRLARAADRPQRAASASSSTCSAAARSRRPATASSRSSTARRAPSAAPSAMVGACHAMGIEIRAGVHTGEVELVGDDVRGIAVHVAARVMSLAGAGRGPRHGDDRPTSWRAPGSRSRTPASTS